MNRCTWILAAVCALLVPAGLSGQQDVPFDDPVLRPGAQAESSSEETGGAEVFLGAFRAIRNYHMDSFPDSLLWERALDGLIESLDDPYATVFSPEEFRRFQEGNTGNYAGIGVTISELNERITITAVFRGAPADRVGLQVGDYIVGVDGEDAREWTVEQASQKIRGPEGSSVDVRVSRAGLEEPLPFTIPRDQVHVPAVTAEMISESVGYILLDRVARNSAAEVDSALAHLDGARGLVFDLRRNPGGYLDEALDLADLFLERGRTIASARSRVPGEAGETREESWEAQSGPSVDDIPVVVLVDQYSASASEIVAGALQDHDRALVMGERTFGKGVVQTVMRIPGDWRIRLTTGSWYTPLGRSLHRPRDAQGQPLTENDDAPDVVLTDSGREVVAGGGVFPDLPLATDTLTAAEQELIRASSEMQVPLNLSIAEFAFEEAQRIRQEGAVDRVILDPAALASFVDELVAAGLPREILANPEAESYLSWRIRGQIAERLDRTDLSLITRMERDNILAQAVRLLEGVQTQSELFAAAREYRAGDDRIETARSEIEVDTDQPVGINH